MRVKAKRFGEKNLFFPLCLSLLLLCLAVANNPDANYSTEVTAAKKQKESSLATVERSTIGCEPCATSLGLVTRWTPKVTMSTFPIDSARPAKHHSVYSALWQTKKDAG